MYPSNLWLRGVSIQRGAFRKPERFPAELQAHTAGGETESGMIWELLTKYCLHFLSESVLRLLLKSDAPSFFPM